jgi:hypothetical protein
VVSRFSEKIMLKHNLTGAGPSVIYVKGTKSRGVPTPFSECRKWPFAGSYMGIVAKGEKRLSGPVKSSQKTSSPHLNFFDQFNGHTKLALFEQTAKHLAVHKINRWRAISCRFTTSIRSESTRGDYQALVRAADHGTPKISDDTCANRTPPALILKQHMK